MNDKELNLRAGLAAFTETSGEISADLQKFDVLNSNEDLVRLLIATGISFTRPTGGCVGAESGGDEHFMEHIGEDGLLAAARRAAAKVAASWTTDEDVARYTAAL